MFMKLVTALLNQLFTLHIASKCGYVQGLGLILDFFYSKQITAAIAWPFFLPFHLYLPTPAKGT